MRGVFHGFSQETSVCSDSSDAARSSVSHHGVVHVMAGLFTLFLALRILEIGDVSPPLISSFADDLICLPLILGMILLLHRKGLKRGASYTLPKFHGLVSLILFAVFFEAVLPLWKSNATADPWDLLMYFLGYVFFELWMNKPSINSRSCFVKNLPDYSG